MTYSNLLEQPKTSQKTYFTDYLFTSHQFMKQILINHKIVKSVMPALHLHRHHHLKEQDLQFMKEKSHLTAQFAKLVLSEKSPEMYLLSQFMRKENQSHVNYVILVTCRRFMKVRSYSNAVFVICSSFTSSK